MKSKKDTCKDELDWKFNMLREDIFERLNQSNREIKTLTFSVDQFADNLRELYKAVASDNQRTTERINSYIKDTETTSVKVGVVAFVIGVISTLIIQTIF